MRKEQKRGNKAENERVHDYPKPRAKLPGLLHGNSTLIVQLVSMPGLSVPPHRKPSMGADQQFFAPWNTPPTTAFARQQNGLASCAE